MKLFKVLGYTLIIVLLAVLGFTGFLIIGNQQGWASAIQISEWLALNWGVTVTGGLVLTALGILAAIAKFIGSITGLVTTSTNETQNTNVNLALTVSELASIAGTVTELRNQLVLQPSIIKDMRNELTDSKTQQKLQTEMLTVVMRKVTNDPSVLKVIDSFATGELMAKLSAVDDNVKLASATVTKVNTESKNVLSQIKKDNSKLIIA